MASLNGLRILNTRPLDQGMALTKKIESAQGKVITLPVLEISPTPPCWLERCVPLEQADLSIFISANAVKYCFLILQEKQVNWPNSTQVIAVGEATRNLLLAQGIASVICPAEPNSEALLELPQLQDCRQRTIYLFKGQGGRPLLEETLQARGAHLINVVTYQRQLPQTDSEFVRSIWQNDAVDIILITSIEGLENLLTLFPVNTHEWLKTKLFYVISSRIATFAKAKGITNLLTGTMEKLVETINTGWIHDHQRE